MESERSSSVVPLVIAVLIGVVLGAGAMYLVSLPRHVPPGPAATPVVGGAPAVAPLAERPRSDEDIVQRTDGRVMIHSGTGSVFISPKQAGGWTYAFGYRPVAGSPVDPATWTALIRLRQDRKLQTKLKLTPDQLNEFERTGGAVPCPAADRAAVQNLFEAYVAAGAGAAQAAPRKALLDRVKQTGEAQGPLVAKWLEERLNVLNEDQRSLLNETINEVAAKP